MNSRFNFNHNVINAMRLAVLDLFRVLKLLHSTETKKIKIKGVISSKHCNTGKRAGVLAKLKSFAQSEGFSKVIKPNPLEAPVSRLIIT